MSGTITLGGLASGLDTEGIISGLVSAGSTNLKASLQRATLLRSATSTLSDIGRSLASLQTAVTALSTVEGATSLKATASSSAISATAGSGALAGTVELTVSSLAAAQRTYSASYASATDALGQTGSISIAVGSGTPVALQIAATDSLTTIASHINDLGLRISASVFQDGTSSRLLIRGLDTGIASALTFTETGTTLDLNGDGSNPAGGKTLAATDAQLLVDGYSVSRSTNQIADVIKGVTLTLNSKSDSPVTLSVAPDNTALQTKLTAVMTAFNSTVQSIHVAAGYGTVKAGSAVLSGDPSLRTITDRLSSLINTTTGTGTFSMLAELGLSLTRDGTLQLDNTKLSSALAKDPSGAASFLAEKMASIQSALSELTTGDESTLGARQKTLTDQAAKLDTWAAAEQERLDRYADALRKQFTAMETAVSQSQALIMQLSKIGA